MTEFGDTIQVTLQVELYAFLRELAMTLKGKLSNVFSDAPVDSLSGVGSSGLNNSGSGSSSMSSGVPAGQGSSLARSSKLPKPPRSNRVTHLMNVKAFLLEPRVNVLENLTPYALGKVFELLKIGDPRMMIPEAVHGSVVDGAEKLLFGLKDVFIVIDNFYNPPVHVPDNKAPNIPALKVGGKSLGGSMKRVSSSVSMMTSQKKEDSPRSKAFKISGSKVGTPVVPKLIPGKDEPGDDLFSLLDEDFD